MRIQILGCLWIGAIVIALGACLPIHAGWAAGDDPSDGNQKVQWVTARLLNENPQLPFSFTYDGKPSVELLAAWPKKTEIQKLDDSRTQYTRIWSDAKTGLEVRYAVVDYSDFPAVEWTVYFKNTGRENTPILENIQGLDANIEQGNAYVLLHLNGDTSNENLYQPFDLPLTPNAVQRFAPNGGRGSNGQFPYYNLGYSGGGMLIAVGWPGQWATTFTRDAGNGLRITAGQELTHMALQPGEQVRSPLIALVFWKGQNFVQAQNLWRRWMWAHNVPRTAKGALPTPSLFGNTSLWFNEMCESKDKDQMFFLDRYKEERIQLNYWWMDAGWYPCKGSWPNTGTWEPDLTRFPNGLRAVSDHGLAQGVKTLVWFEPERVAGDTWISNNHPDWLLGNTLLNLGKPEVLKWLTDHVDRVLTEQGIHFYRQDFNMDPLDFWRKNDAPDRQGITENLHIQNYLAYWDALRARHPDLIIDSCASGGRRNDLETMRRAVALHPTDFNYSNLSVKQAFHYSLFQWIPFYASNTMPVDTVDLYAFRSGHAMGVVLGYDLRRKDHNCDLLRKLTGEWRAISPYYYGDYYPLTPYSIDESQWIAWQFYRPESGDGVVEAFRRPKNQDNARTLLLCGLDAGATYEFTDLDEETPKTFSGKELLEKGLPVEIKTNPGAVTITYKKVK